MSRSKPTQAMAFMVRNRKKRFSNSRPPLPLPGNLVSLPGGRQHCAPHPGNDDSRVDDEGGCVIAAGPLSSSCACVNVGGRRVSLLFACLSSNASERGSSFQIQGPRLPDRCTNRLTCDNAHQRLTPNKSLNKHCYFPKFIFTTVHNARISSLNPSTLAGNTGYH